MKLLAKLPPPGQVVRLGGVGDVECSGGEGFAASGGGLLEPEDGESGFKQAVGEGVGVVVLVRDEITGGLACADDSACGWRG